MSFQTRLFLTYFLLIIMLVAILSFSFYTYTSGVFESNAYTNLKVITDKMSQQLDNILRPMDLMSTYLLCTDRFVSSMTSLETIDRNTAQNQIYINDARRIIYSNVLNYTTDKNFYRVSFFNKKGDFLTSSFKIQSVTGNIDGLINSLDWTEQADRAEGRAAVIAPYEDPWAINKKSRVFGLVRCVQGPKGGMGYIEIQQLYSGLEKIFSIPGDESIKVLAITGNGDIFFGDKPENKALASFYTEFAAKARNTVSIQQTQFTGRDEIIASVKSDYSGIRIILVQDRAALLKPLLYIANLTIVISLMILFVSLGYIYIFSRQLAKPVRQLREKMEGTELENLPDKIVFESSNNEFKALNKSFQRLRVRLNEAVSREIKAHSLQIQANFDSLQAQVNPHFIYNILNVLSNRGLANSDEEICEICDGIASMLRYSTNTLKRTAAIREELEHVSNYLLLMKKRFEHKLDFTIDVASDIYEETIPKIVLQQIVENSINHGFVSFQGKMEIGIRGYQSEGWWFIEIIDNGQGFDAEVLDNLKNRMACIKKEITGNEQNTCFNIGGMGLLNTYARMLLFFNGQFEFILGNNGAGGAKVTIGGSRDKNEPI